MADKRLRDLEHETLDRQTATNEVLEGHRPLHARPPTRPRHRGRDRLQAVPGRSRVTSTWPRRRACTASRPPLRAGRPISTSSGPNPHRVGRETVTGRVVPDRSAGHVDDVLADPETTGRRPRKRHPDAARRADPQGRRRHRGDRAGRCEVRRSCSPRSCSSRTFAEQVAIATENARLVEIDRAPAEPSSPGSCRPQVAALISSPEARRCSAGHRRRSPRSSATCAGSPASPRPPSRRSFSASCVTTTGRWAS